MLHTTAFTIHGHGINHEHGIVRGITVRSRSVVGCFGSIIPTLFGSKMNLSKYLLVTCFAVVFSLGCPRTTFAQSQGEMNAQAAHAFQAADVKLNRVYKQLMDKVDGKSQGKLKIAQRAWIAFRDGQADLQADLDARGGTMAPLIYETYRASMTEARTKELAAMLKDAD